MANYRNFWVTWADTKSVSPLCSLEHVQKISSSGSPSMPLSPRELHFFSSCYSFTYQGSQMLSWGLLPILRHQRWTDVKTPQSTCWETELIQKPRFFSPDLHTHLYLFTHAHNAKRAAVRGRTISSNWCMLSASPSPHLLPPSLCEMHQISGQTKTILFIWTYPRTELDPKGIPTKPVKWGGFGGLLSPLTI